MPNTPPPPPRRSLLPLYSITISTCLFLLPSFSFHWNLPLCFLTLLTSLCNLSVICYLIGKSWAQCSAVVPLRWPPLVISDALLKPVDWCPWAWSRNTSLLVCLPRSLDYMSHIMCGGAWTITPPPPRPPQPGEKLQKSSCEEIRKQQPSFGVMTEGEQRTHKERKKILF